MSEELETKGWIKRTTIDEPRLSEIVKEYKTLGYEVRLEPVKLENLNENCRKCYRESIHRIKTIYVRKKK